MLQEIKNFLITPSRDPANVKKEYLDLFFFGSLKKEKEGMYDVLCADLTINFILFCKLWRENLEDERIIPTR